ncbi:hypothetical protein ABZS29_17825 [Kribbella sp. NPDC005582]|uniref:hypothetical protein n=1 Tax=Kribbella sp. NPDC005582 TaxID=3156893 RepID=UPI0033AD5F4E
MTGRISRRSALLVAGTAAVAAKADYQPEMYAGVRSVNIKLMMLNAKALARLAVKLKMPVVLGAVGVTSGTNHSTLAVLRG